MRKPPSTAAGSEACAISYFTWPRQNLALIGFACSFSAREPSGRSLNCILDALLIWWGALERLMPGLVIADLDELLALGVAARLVAGAEGSLAIVPLPVVLALHRIHLIAHHIGRDRHIARLGVVRRPVGFVVKLAAGWAGDEAQRAGDFDLEGHARPWFGW